jgi:hypothetical protein
MFLLGGPAFSGKTLLAHLLNQGLTVCLDEPDFHDPMQDHRGIPFLRRLFPDKAFPERPEGELTYGEAVALLRRCEEAVRPFTIGMKTAGSVFLEYARIYRASGYPTIGIVRDIRDVLAEAPLPEWIDGERELNAMYRLIWTNLELCDLWVRYEDLVTNAEAVMAGIAKLLSCDLKPVTTWTVEGVHRTMFKLDRHEMLRLGRISRTQIGLWKTCGHAFSDDTKRTATLMGYGGDG